MSTTELGFENGEQESEVMMTARKTTSPPKRKASPAQIENLARARAVKQTKTLEREQQLKALNEKFTDLDARVVSLQTRWEAMEMDEEDDENFDDTRDKPTKTHEQIQQELEFQKDLDLYYAERRQREKEQQQTTDQIQNQIPGLPTIQHSSPAPSVPSFFSFRNMCAAGLACAAAVGGQYLMRHANEWGKNALQQWGGQDMEWDNDD